MLYGNDSVVPSTSGWNRCCVRACSWATIVVCALPQILPACPVAGLWWRPAPLTRREPRKDPLLAASRSTSTPAISAPRRISFAKISEPLAVPQLLALQTDSFDWLVGNERWQARVADRQAAGEDVSTKTGLQEIFEEISPIEDFSETMSLSFENPVFYDPKYTEEECKEKDFTYSAPLYVSAEFTNGETGEIKGQTVFMGDFPLMTRKGTFIINGTERVVVSQLVRSPGVYFERSADKTSDKDI